MKARLQTGFVAGPVLIAILAVPGGWAFLVVLAAAAVIAVREAYQLLSRGLIAHSRTAALLVALLYVLVPLACIACIRRLPFGEELPLGDWGRPVPYLDFGFWRMVLILLTTWSGDTTAYFAGRAFGRHKMAPSLSPGKTWEGSAANFGACVLVGALLGIALHLGWGVGLACGALIGVLGQAGDLLESKMKRTAGVKDSGNLLPGHGGMLDRIDSMMLPAPFLLALFLLTYPVVLATEAISN